MAYKNLNRNKDKWPWMGQRFTEGKKERKVFLTKKEALLWEAEGTMEVQNVLPPPSLKIPTVFLGEWAVKYLDFVREKHLERIYNSRVYAFKRLFELISKDTACENLTLYDAQKALQHQAKTRSGNAANKDLSHFRTAWKWGVKYLDMPDRNVFLSIDKFSSKRSDRYVPPLEDFWKVYHSLQDDQDKLMLYCFLQTGARANEMWRLTWSDVDFFNHRIRLKSRKNRLAEWKSDWLDVNDDLMQWLKRHNKATKGGVGEYVWKFVRSGRRSNVCRSRVLKDFCLKAGVEEFTFHCIRHLFASLLAMKNVPLVEIQRMCRHTSILTTQRYIHSLVTNNKRAMQALPSLEESTSKVHQPLRAQG